MPRCARCGTDPLYIDYHDREWGVPARDPQVLFEFLLEAFQAGFPDHRIAQARALPAGAVRLRCRAPARMSDAEIDERMQDPGIIRNRRKLEAARSNARARCSWRIR